MMSVEADATFVWPVQVPPVVSEFMSSSLCCGDMASVATVNPGSSKVLGISYLFFIKKTSTPKSITRRIVAIVLLNINYIIKFFERHAPSMDNHKHALLQYCGRTEGAGRFFCHFSKIPFSPVESHPGCTNFQHMNIFKKGFSMLTHPL